MERTIKCLVVLTSIIILSLSPRYGSIVQNIRNFIYRVLFNCFSVKRRDSFHLCVTFRIDDCLRVCSTGAHSLGNVPGRNKAIRERTKDSWDLM